MCFERSYYLRKLINFLGTANDAKSKNLRQYIEMRERDSGLLPLGAYALHVASQV
jgi:hypothetical protein